MYVPFKSWRLKFINTEIISFKLFWATQKHSVFEYNSVILFAVISSLLIAIFQQLKKTDTRFCFQSDLICIIDSCAICWYYLQMLLLL